MRRRPGSQAETVTETRQQIVHATAVAFEADDGPVGVLLRGAPGTGKSDLALRLIDAGAALVADDRTVLRCAAGRVLMSAPETIRDRLEVRGLGIMRVSAVTQARLVLIVDLVRDEPVERLPPARYETVGDVAIPLIALDPRESSAAAKVRLGVRAAACGILFVQD